MRCTSAARLFWDAFIPARPRLGRSGYNRLIPIIERARGARWAGQAAKTGEFPDVTVKAAGICSSSKQEPVWRADHMLKPGRIACKTFHTIYIPAAMRPIYRPSTLLPNSGR